MELTYVLYPGVEPIDLAALGVISMARRVVPELSYRTVAATHAPVILANGLRVLPDLSYDEVDAIDVLMIPGGPGWRKAAEDVALLGFIRKWNTSGTICSVCTGAMILAAAGTLDGREATTKSAVVPPECSPMDELRERYDNVSVVNALLVDSGRVVTGGGVTLCIDATLYLIACRYGPEAADEVARIMEYEAAARANASRLPKIVREGQRLQCSSLPRSA
jgi:transcriptional regulator GlxA family with amidase domain